MSAPELYSHVPKETDDEVTPETSPEATVFFITADNWKQAQDEGWRFAANVRHDQPDLPEYLQRLADRGYEIAYGWTRNADEIVDSKNAIKGIFVRNRS
jgi:hypothetical protein